MIKTRNRYQLLKKDLEQPRGVRIAKPSSTSPPPPSPSTSHHALLCLKLNPAPQERGCPAPSGQQLLPDGRIFKGALQTGTFYHLHPCWTSTDHNNPDNSFFPGSRHIFWFITSQVGSRNSTRASGEPLSLLSHHPSQTIKPVLSFHKYQGSLFP